MRSLTDEQMRYIVGDLANADFNLCPVDFGYECKDCGTCSVVATCTACWMRFLPLLRIIDEVLE
jgi:hypothetical protein